MADLPYITGWQCNIAIDGMSFDKVEISQVSNAGVVINDNSVEIIPWAAIRLITKTGDVEANPRVLAL